LPHVLSMPRRELISDRVREWRPKRERLAPGVVFSHRSAASLHGLDLGRHPLIQVTAPYGGAVWPRPGCTSDTPGWTMATPASGKACPSRRRCVRPSAWRGTSLPVEAVAAVDMMLHRRLVDVAALEQYVLDRSGWQGVAQARRVVELAETATESWMESILRMILIEASHAPEFKSSSAAWRAASSHAST
jgi:hypothetical protein